MEACVCSCWHKYQCLCICRAALVCTFSKEILLLRKIVILLQDTMGPKKKAKLTKAQKLALKKQKEEQLRKEEEEAQRLAALEEKKRREEERRRQEELEKIKLEEAGIREKQQPKLLSFFQSIESIHKTNRNISWEEWQWHCYVNKWKTINPFSLPMVNSFVSAWDEQDESYKMDEFFTVCHECLDIIHKVDAALVSCPNLDSKSESQWREIQYNLKKALNRKFDVVTYLLLRDSSSSISPDSYNMEYGVVDLDFVKPEAISCPQMTVILWANFVKNIRYKGMEVFKLGFKFELPEPLVKIPCAVRFLHIPIDTVSIFEEAEEDIDEESVTQEYEALIESFRAFIDEPKKKSVEMDSSKSAEAEKVAESEEKLFSSESSNIEEDAPKKEEVLSGGTESASRSTSTTSMTGYSSSTEVPHSDVTPEIAEGSSVSLLSSSTTHQSSTAYEHRMTEFVLESDSKEKAVINYSKHFLVGGIFHFEMIEIPTQPIEAGSWIMIHCEEKKPVKIPYHIDITPIRQPQPNISLAAAAEFSDAEIKRFEQEMSYAISITFCLPKDVIFMELPIPAIWDKQDFCFSRDGFFDINLDEEEDQLSFKINRFGKIGLFQRKYANHPLKSWEINVGDDPNSVNIVLTGTKLTLEIFVNAAGCSIKKLDLKGGKLILQELYNKFMTPPELVQKLYSVGICVEYDKNASDQIRQESKQGDFESWTHMCISILCSAFVFSWSKWNRQSTSDLIVLNCKAVSEEGPPRLVLVTPERAHYLKVAEDDETFSSEPEDNQKFCSDLYHLLVKDEKEADAEKNEAGIEEKEVGTEEKEADAEEKADDAEEKADDAKEKAADTEKKEANADLVMRVYSLLQAFKLFSCS